jgi:hypothetical protein
MLKPKSNMEIPEETKAVAKEASNSKYEAVIEKEIGGEQKTETMAARQYSLWADLRRRIAGSLVE